MTKISDLGITQDGTYLLSKDGKAYPVEMNTGYVVGVRSLRPHSDVPAGLFGRRTDYRGTDYPTPHIVEFVYWDEVELIDELENALHIAAVKGELAIWDNANQQEIRV